MRRVGCCFKMLQSLMYATMHNIAVNHILVGYDSYEKYGRQRVKDMDMELALKQGRNLERISHPHLLEEEGPKAVAWSLCA